MSARCSQASPSGWSQEGIPLVRAYLALPTVNPTIRVYTHVWTRSAGMIVEGVSHERNELAFEQSPFAYMMKTEQTSCYWLHRRSGGA